MLSILIPIYNFEITKLINELISQCLASNITFEIICIDDASDHKFKIKNHPISNIENLTYVELEENIGRSRIRNLLTHKAKYEIVLFLDCDSQIAHPDFISTYLKAIDQNPKAIIAGGTKYSSQKPSKDKCLHWHYGSKREALSSDIRSLQPYSHFHSNSFVAVKKLLLQFPFDEVIQGYGYEDLEWAFRLKANHCQILHIDNPVLHLGLKSNKDFLADQESAIFNLSKIYKEGKIPPTRLIRAYNRLNNWHLTAILKYLPLKSLALYRISSLRLMVLDLTKVYYLDKHI